MTEPDAGSDLPEIRTSRKGPGDHFLLNGSKIYMTPTAINADYVHRGAPSSIRGRTWLHRRAGTPWCWLVVERGMEGFERLGPNTGKRWGWKAQDTAGAVFFNNVKGSEGKRARRAGPGFQVLNAQRLRKRAF